MKLERDTIEQIEDWLEQQIDKVIQQRQESCVCPICTDGEWHKANCEIGALEDRIDELETTLKALYGTVGQKAWLRRWPIINAKVRTVLALD